MDKLMNSWKIQLSYSDRRMPSITKIELNAYNEQGLIKMRTLWWMSGNTLEDRIEKCMELLEVASIKIK